MTIDLTDAQCSLLAPACTRDDRNIFPVTAKLKGGSVGNVLKSLLKRQLITEVPANDADTVWRCGDDGEPLTLRVTDDGMLAIGGQVEGPAERGERMIQPEIVEDDVPAAKRHTTQEALLGLLRRSEGATIAEMQSATSWQPHSVRGALSGLVRKKLGYEVTSAKEERGRVYRIAD
jgi:hypothetical protein